MDLNRIQQVQQSADAAARREREEPPPHIQTGAPALAGGGRAYIAQVDSSATGGGYYNCHLQSLNATDWNSTTAGQTADVGVSVIVLNLLEIPITGDTASHILAADDYILCWPANDDEGHRRYVGLGQPKPRLGPLCA